MEIQIPVVPKVNISNQEVQPISTPTVVVNPVQSNPIQTQKVGTINPLLKSDLDDVEFDTAKDMISEPDVFRLLVFGLPAMGKTHFGCTMPAPVIFLDSEKRVKLIVGKFSDANGKQKNIISKQWRTMDELIFYTNAAIRKLQLHQQATGEIGTIVIDSVSKAWEAAQTKYIREVYGNINLENKTMNPRDDYKHINPIHNNWRDTLMDSGFNILLTATEGDIYSTEKKKQFDIIGVKPEGQKHNMYAVDYHMYLYKNPSGQYLGMIRKNSLMRQSATGQVNVNLNSNDVQNLDFDKFNIEVQKARELAGIRTLEDILREEQEGINNE